MYKNQLQELCSRRMWDSPEYNCSRDGPDHSPRFRASVTVNGQTFDASELSKTLKGAQIKAAQVAVDRLSTVVAAPSSPALSTADTQPFDQSATDFETSYKSQLQIYVQKRNIRILKYESIYEGVFHAPRFKAKVTVDRQTFESQEFFSTLRQAEHAAAKVALMSLPKDFDKHQEEPNFYKNLLQQLLQKEHLPLPSYNTKSDGASHMPFFTSTIVVEGESFVGDSANTKKQAEMNAAKVAWHHLNERINDHSRKAGFGEVLENLELQNVHSLAPSLVMTEKRNETTEGEIQRVAGLSLECKLQDADLQISLRNQSKAVSTVEQPTVSLVSTSTSKIEEENQAIGVNSFLEQKKIQSMLTPEVEIQEIDQADGGGFLNQVFY
ncbi:Double-stranded RNA-binding protein 1 [Apostasia shenzhenica]|uniref:Double-stranded RNA-binding protein 1 n=1 Tax=Apostasia shenzhenica TaxID=1088818 RepID=A0A2H9ZR85_9ASPA|nr:Double-stranded RNA-binding protein 1 [Apostasia shenzhenica]